MFLICKIQYFFCAQLQCYVNKYPILQKCFKGARKNNFLADVSAKGGGVWGRPQKSCNFYA